MANIVEKVVAKMGRESILADLQRAVERLEANEDHKVMEVYPLSWKRSSLLNHLAEERIKRGIGMWAEELKED